MDNLSHVRGNESLLFTDPEYYNQFIPRKLECIGERW